MRIQGIIATTYVDFHHMRFTKEALESAAEQINGPRKPKLGVEHDETVPPLGKILEARVEPIGDGEYRLVQIAEVFEQIQGALLSDGSVLLKQECETDRSPFLSDDSSDSEGFVLGYDWVNFGPDDNRRSFLDEVRHSAGVEFEEKEFLRKAALPDPEIIIRLSHLLVQYLIAKKVLEAIGDEILEQALKEVTKFYAFARSAVISAFKYALPRNRPITYIFELPGRPMIQLVASTTKPDLVLSAIAQDKLESALARASQLHATLHAEKIQLLLNADCQWEFNYLLTDSGAVVGTEKSFSRRTRRLQMMSSKLEEAEEGSDPTPICQETT